MDSNHNMGIIYTQSIYSKENKKIKIPRIYGRYRKCDDIVWGISKGRTKSACERETKSMVRDPNNIM